MKRTISLILAAALLLTLSPGLLSHAQAATGGKLAALTFDDGPSSKYTEQLLDGLKERDVPVTFFMLGERADWYPDVVQRAYEEGHEIASHTWDHPDLTELNNSQILEQMEKSFDALDEACGQGTEYLVRPPYGSTNSRVRAAIQNPLLYWSVDSRDWESRNSEKVRDRIVADAFDGCIILCHDIHKTTVPGVLQAIDILESYGYEFVTVSELYRRRGVKLQDGVLHYSCKPNGRDDGPIPAPKISCSADSNGTITVRITCEDSDAPIYYTLDGSYPNQTAKRYAGPFTVDYFTEVTAVAAYNLNGSRSDLAYLMPEDYPCLTPQIWMNESDELVLYTKTPGAKMYYTLDNTQPDASDRRYFGPVAIPGGSYVRAVAIHDQAGTSPVSGMWYYSVHGKFYRDMDPGKWYYDAMERLHLSGILNGTAPFTMEPEGTLTRGMLVTLLMRCSGEGLGESWKKTNDFTDVPSAAYYAPAVEWAYRNGIVNGYSTIAFGPEDPVTRQQMCKIAAYYLTHMDKPLLPGGSCIDIFADADEVADWALESVSGMVGAGLIRGDGVYLRPEKATTRAEFATVLCRMLDYADAYVPPMPEPEPTESSDPTVPKDGTAPVE